MKLLKIKKNLRKLPSIIIAQIAPGLLVKRGTVIEMPLVPCHLNPEYFSEPEKFDPDRFLKENVNNIIPISYRPFGGEFMSYMCFNTLDETSTKLDS